MNSILKSYFPVADIIAGTFGKRCEVAVHDLTQPENSVIYVANGSVTGRKVGQSFDHLVKQVLLNENFSDDHLTNYTFTASNGKRIRSSSAIIRNEKNEIIGMLCINYDTSLEMLLQEEAGQFYETVPKSTSEVENSDQSVNEIIDSLITNIIGKNDVRNMTRKKSVELVKFMDEKGIFLVKGAIDKVASLMGVSKVTIYSYLDEAKGKR